MRPRSDLQEATRRALERASQILAVSKSTRDDLIDIFDVDTKRISVIYNALDERFGPAAEGMDRKTVLERYQLHDPFILYSGRIRPHKNVHRLIEAFARFPMVRMSSPRRFFRRRKASPRSK